MHSSSLDVVYTQPGGRGWAPIEVLAELAARSFGGELHRYTDTGYSRTFRARTLLPRVRASRGDCCLVIAPTPVHLNAILEAPELRRRYAGIAGWTIDSFWTDKIPRAAKTARHYDHLYVIDHEDQEQWQSETGRPVSCLPWGTDVLGTPDPDKKVVDLQRVGRQPPQWEDDGAAATAAAARGLRYAGRPEFGSTDAESQANVSRAYRQAKYVLAFSNGASPASYTHPTREYLTGRWLDAIGSGAVVAGIVPKTRVARELLWPDATLELPTIERDAGLEAVTEAVRNWTPAIAQNNRRLAARLLDWRHRLKVVADDFGANAPTLHSELAALAPSARDVLTKPADAFLRTDRRA